MEVDYNYGRLPELVLDKLFLLLSPQDLKSIVLVCRAWWAVGRLPKFWTWVRLRVIIGNLRILPEIIRMNRLSSMKSIKVEALSKEMLRAIKCHPGIEEVVLARTAFNPHAQQGASSNPKPPDNVTGLLDVIITENDEYKLKKLNASGINLSSVGKGLLAKVVNDMEAADLTNCNLKVQQLQAIFRLAADKSRLKKINVWANKVSKSTAVDPTSLAKAINNMEEVNLGHTNLNIEQSNAIFNFAVDNSKLKTLNVRNVDLSFADPESLAKAVNKMEAVDFSNTQLNSEQTNAIFMTAADESKLKNLNIQGVNLSTTVPEYLAVAINKMEGVNLSNTRLNGLQVQAIFQQAADESKVRKLSMRHAVCASADPESIAKAVSKMEEVDLSDTSLNGLQTKAILRLAAEGSTLMKLIMACADFSLVDPESIAKAVTKIKEVDFSHSSGMTDQQSHAIFAARDCKLTKLKMKANDLSSVDPETMSKTIFKIKTVDLGLTNLKTEQSNTIFKLSTSSDSKLENLNLERVNLTAVEPELLSEAVNNVEEVDLCATGLTTQQCHAILIRLKNGSKLKKLNLSRNGSLSTVNAEFLVGAIANLEKVVLGVRCLSKQQHDAITDLRDKLQFKKKHDWLPKDLLSCLDPFFC